MPAPAKPFNLAAEIAKAAIASSQKSIYTYPIPDLTEDQGLDLVEELLDLFPPGPVIHYQDGELTINPFKSNLKCCS